MGTAVYLFVLVVCFPPPESLALYSNSFNVYHLLQFACTGCPNPQNQISQSPCIIVLSQVRAPCWTLCGGGWHDRVANQNYSTCENACFPLWMGLVFRPSLWAHEHLSPKYTAGVFQQKRITLAKHGPVKPYWRSNARSSGSHSVTIMPEFIIPPLLWMGYWIPLGLHVLGCPLKKMLGQRFLVCSQDDLRKQLWKLQQSC